jgi:CRP/FNR family transcriptional regulator, cyclic AMP receptor protein
VTNQGPPDARRPPLDRLPLFAGVPEAARARLAAAARPVGYAAGEAVFRRGDPGEDMLVLLDGLVRLHLATPGGRELTLGLVGPGEPIGEIALIDGGPRSADATALTPARGLTRRQHRCLNKGETWFAKSLMLLRVRGRRPKV